MASTGTDMLNGIYAIQYAALAILGLLISTATIAQSLPVAVAANVQFAFAELATAFTARSGVNIQASYASTGKIAAQIQNGAPFALFLAADENTPAQLARAGFTLAAPVVYAEGALVLWSLDPGFEPETWPSWLRRQTGKIALAEPRLAPYGQAARATLAYYQLQSAVETRLVYGENIAQTAHFVLSGAAQAGFVAKALVLAPTTVRQGRWVDIPATAHAPLRQSLVLLKPAARHRAAFALVDFLLHDPHAAQIWRRYGYHPLTP